MGRKRKKRGSQETSSRTTRSAIGRKIREGLVDNNAEKILDAKLEIAIGLSNEDAEAKAQTDKKDEEMVDYVHGRSLSIIDTLGEGQCFFDAISKELLLGNGPIKPMERSTHSNVRKRVIRWLREHQDEWVSFLVPDKGDENNKDKETPDEYLARMSRPLTFANAFEVKAASSILRRVIHVYSWDYHKDKKSQGPYQIQKPHPDGTEPEGPPILLFYRWNNHYDLLRAAKNKKDVTRYEEELKNKLLGIESGITLTDDEVDTVDQAKNHEVMVPDNADQETRVDESVGQQNEADVSRRKNGSESQEVSDPEKIAEDNGARNCDDSALNVAARSTEHEHEASPSSNVIDKNVNNTVQVLNDQGVTGGKEVTTESQDASEFGDNEPEDCNEDATNVAAGSTDDIEENNDHEGDEIADNAMTRNANNQESAFSPDQKETLSLSSDGQAKNVTFHNLCAAGDLCGMKFTQIETPAQHYCMDCAKPLHGNLCGILWCERPDTTNIIKGKNSIIASIYVYALHVSNIIFLHCSFQYCRVVVKKGARLMGFNSCINV